MRVIVDVAEFHIPLQLMAAPVPKERDAPLSEPVAVIVAEPLMPSLGVKLAAHVVVSPSIRWTAEELRSPQPKPVAEIENAPKTSGQLVGPVSRVLVSATPVSAMPVSPGVASGLGLVSAGAESVGGAVSIATVESATPPESAGVEPGGPVGSVPTSKQPSAPRRAMQTSRMDVVTSRMGVSVLNGRCLPDSSRPWRTVYRTRHSACRRRRC